MKENFRKLVLENGFTILFEKRDIPVTSVSISLRSGGINETLSNRGISHFLEHMVYKGTKKRNSFQISSEIENEGGELNGFTSEEITCFWSRIPSDKTYIALDVLTDIVKNPLFLEKEIDKERKVILEEIKSRKDNSYQFVLDKIPSTLYLGLFSKDLAGDSETLNKIKKNDLIKWHNRFFIPKNLILTVVGQEDFEEIVKFAKKNFDFKNNFSFIEPKIKKRVSESKEEREGISQSVFGYSFYLPKANTKGFFVAEVLVSLLTEGMSSRLFREIREKRNLAYDVRGAIDSHKNYSFGFILVGSEKKNLPSVKKLIEKEFLKVSKSLTKKELDLVKEKLIGLHKISMEGSHSEMLSLIMEEIDGKAEYHYDYEKNISNVCLEDVKNLSLKIYTQKKGIVELVSK